MFWLVFEVSLYSLGLILFKILVSFLAFQRAHQFSFAYNTLLIDLVLIL